MRKNDDFGSSVGNALRGIVTVLRDERNFKIQLAAAALAALACLILRVTPAEAAIVALCCAAVLGTECINSAVEYTVDLISPEYHALAKKAKDAAAGAVLVVAIGSVVVAAIIFIPHLPEFFERMM